MTDDVKHLRRHLAEIEDLRTAAHLLGWDQQTMMPRRGAPARAEALATLERISHEMFTSGQTGHLLDAAAENLNGTPTDSDDARLISVVRRRWEKARRVPSELAADLARASSIGQEAWIDARERSDFNAFAPYLARNLELARDYVSRFDEFECAYDALLDDYDPGMRTTKVASLFDELKAELIPLVFTLADREVDAAVVHERFPVDAQRRLVDDVVRRMGFNPESWRLDDTVHPFATSFGSHDVRITTRWDEQLLPLGPVRRHARVRPRALRGRNRRLASAHAARPHRVAEPARVAEPPVGEHGRPRPRVLRRARAADGGAPRRRHRRRRPVPRGEPGRALAHPGRGRRGDLRAAHHSPVRARAAADRGPARYRRPARGLERPDEGVPRARRARQRPGRAPGRALVGRADRLLPDLLARQPDRGPAVGAGQRGHPRAGRQHRGQRSRAPARVAARARPPLRVEVLHQRAARARARHRDRGRPVRRAT